MNNKIVLSLCKTRALTEADIPLMVEAFEQIGWNKPSQLFQKYFEEQKNNERCVWVVFNENVFLGYVTLKWHSAYQSFAAQKIPEINDLNVMPKFRRQGIASLLLDLAEAEAQKRCEHIGLGVGLYEDYGAAQKLYVKRGYVPDGRGITYKDEPVRPGSTVCVDDDLILWLVKKSRALIEK